MAHGRVEGWMTRVRLRPSRSLAIVVCAAHAVAAVLVLPLQIGAAAKIGLWTVVAASLVRALREALLMGADAIVGATIHDGAHATVSLRSGTEVEARILGTTYVTPMLTALNLHIAGSRFARHVLLVPDNIDREDYRKLRVVLKWARSDASATPSGDSAPPDAR